MLGLIELLSSNTRSRSSSPSYLLRCLACCLIGSAGLWSELGVGEGGRFGAGFWRWGTWKRGEVGLEGACRRVLGGGVVESSVLVRLAFV